MIQRNGKISHALGLEELILKWPYYPKQCTDLVQSLSHYFHIFHRTRTHNPKIYMKPTMAQISETFWRKMNKAGGITIPDFQ